jgi:hypothetical protein
MVGCTAARVDDDGSRRRSRVAGLVGDVVDGVRRRVDCVEHDVGYEGAVEEVVLLDRKCRSMCDFQWREWT